jgi:hypothetical protein
MMVYDNSIQARVEAAQFLISHGTQKKIVNQYCLGIGALYDAICAQMPIVPQRHRKGTHWLRTDSCISATRVIRLIKQVYGTTHLDKPIVASEFVSLCECYAMKFPGDETISPNRIHYLIQEVRSGEALVHESCSTCHKPYVTHRYDASRKTCAHCSMS